MSEHQTGDPRIDALLSELCDLNWETTQAIESIEVALRGMMLTVEIPFGGFYHWTQHRGRWALWHCPDSFTYRAIWETSAKHRADFLAWFSGTTLSDHVCDSLRELIALMRTTLGGES